MSVLLSVKDLNISFRRYDGGLSPAVQGLTLELAKGEGLAIVGESGSGKSVSALALARLLAEPPAVISGQILLNGVDVNSLSREGLRAIRGRSIAYIFQEPGAALNPVFNIGSHMAEVLRLHRQDIHDREKESIRWLHEVGITDPERRLGEYPHQLSGGMQQRVMIAMALAAQPDLIVADEPTTALDVTIQRQIMELLARLKREHGTAILLITHNFGIIRGVADRVGVMLRGSMVEQGPVEQVLKAPAHPYTRGLISCVPRLGQRQRRLPVYHSGA